MTYEFTCKACGKDFEEVRAVDQRNAPARCPHCRSKRTQRMMASRRVGLNTGRGGAIPGWCNTLGKEPVYITSKGHFREEVKKVGGYAPYV